MAWPTRSHQLWKLANGTIGTSITWLGIVPTDHTYLLKDLVVFNQHTAARSFALWAKIDAGLYVVWHTGSIAAASSGQQTGRSIVYPPGTDLGISASVSGLTGVYISGARLGP